MTKDRYKILLLVMIMIISTFASGFTPSVPITGNDKDENFEFKHNSGTSSTWYFDEYGNYVEEDDDDYPTDYWIIFTVSDDELSFTTHNVSIDRLSIKGSNAYIIYTDLGDSESGLTAPVNSSGGPAGISHYSFDITIDPPEKPDVRVEKSIKDMDDGESLAGFMFELWQNDEKVYGPETTNGSGYALFKDVDPGTYDVVELLTGGQSEIYVPEEDVQVTVDEGEEGLVTVSFENSKKDEPKMAKVKVVKDIEFMSDQEIVASVVESSESLEDFEFELWQDGSKVYGPETTNEYGEAIFDDVEPGTYEVVENLTSGQQEMFEPEEDVFVTVDVDEDGTVTVYFTNYKEKDTEETGSLTVHKRIMKENESIVGALGDGEFTVTLEGLIGEDESILREKTIKGTDESGEHVIFNNLPFGTYILMETEIDHEGVTYGDPIYATSGNQNYDLVDNENIIIGLEGTEQVWVINVPEDPWEGSILVEKFFEGEGQYSKSGIEFTLVGPDEYEETLTTGDDGIVEFTELPEGTYTLSEDVPAGFTTSIPTGGLDIVLPDEAGEDYQATVDVTNTEIPEDWEGNIRVIKSFTDESDPEDIAFTLTGPDEYEETKMTDEFGEVEFLNLPKGEYTLTEDTPEGYISSLGAGGMDITLPGDYDWEENDGYMFIDVTNRPEPEDWEGTIRVVKSVDDIRDDDPDLDGFTFRLYMVDDDDEDLIGTRTTGASGIVSFTGLDEGEYILYEDNIANYTEGIDSNGLEITLLSEDADDDILTIEVENIRTYVRDRDPNPRPRPRPEPEPEAEPEPEIEAEVIIPDPEPIPEAAPVVEPEPEPEVEVVEEPTPQATLPRTGASDPTVFAGFGAAFMALGLYLKKKRF